MVSFMNGAPGSSAPVRADDAGSNISYVVRPSRIPWQPAMAPAIAATVDVRTDPVAWTQAADTGTELEDHHER